MTIRDEEIIATAKAYGIEIPMDIMSEFLAKIREKMLTMHIGQALAFCWHEYKHQ